MTLDLLHIPFVQAKGFTSGTGEKRRYDLVVIHTMESPETAHTAEDVARYFQRDARASAHYNVDSDSIVQCVQLQDVAWGAPGANHNGIQLEHAGYAKQGSADWADPYSKAMLDVSEKLTSWLCAKFSIPIQYVDARGLQSGKRGITTHAQATLAFPGPGRTHWDPGPSFPMESYLKGVQAAGGTKPAPRVQGDWPVPLPSWFWTWLSWRLAEGVYAGQHKADPDLRPHIPFGGSGQEPVPQWAWHRLDAFVKARKGL